VAVISNGPQMPKL